MAQVDGMAVISSQDADRSVRRGIESQMVVMQEVLCQQEAREKDMWARQAHENREVGRNLFDHSRTIKEIFEFNLAIDYAKVDPKVIAQQAEEAVRKDLPGRIQSLLPQVPQDEVDTKAELKAHAEVITMLKAAADDQAETTKAASRANEEVVEQMYAIQKAGEARDEMLARMQQRLSKVIEDQKNAPNVEERIAKLFKEQEEAMDVVTTQMKDGQAKLSLSVKNLNSSLLEVHDRLDTFSELYDKRTSKLELRTTGLEDRTDLVMSILDEVGEVQSKEAESSKQNVKYTEKLVKELEKTTRDNIQLAQNTFEERIVGLNATLSQRIDEIIEILSKKVERTDTAVITHHRSLEETTKGEVQLVTLAHRANLAIADRHPSRSDLERFNLHRPRVNASVSANTGSRRSNSDLGVFNHLTLERGSSSGLSSRRMMTVGCGRQHEVEKLTTVAKVDLLSSHEGMKAGGIVQVETRAFVKYLNARNGKTSWDETWLLPKMSKADTDLLRSIRDAQLENLPGYRNDRGFPCPPEDLLRYGTLCLF